MSLKESLQNPTTIELGSTKPVDKKNDSPVDSSLFTFDSDLERTLTWKRDIALVPTLGLLFILLFLDRTNLANARIEGLEEGLQMPPNGFNTALWIFFIPYLLSEVPSNLILNTRRVRPNFWLGGQMLLLGLIAACQGLTHSYAGLLVCRFLLGIFEAAIPAGAAYMLTIYYTVDEAAIRLACFYAFALAAPMFSGLFAYEIESMNGVGGLETWRWIFVVEGLMTFTFGIITLLFLPDFPQRARFLTEKQRRYLVSKISSSRGDEKQDAVKTPIWKILLDWRIHLFTMLFFCADITASSLASFTPTILTQLGWTTSVSHAQIMTMPVWAAGIASTLVGVWTGYKLNQRTAVVMFGIVCQLVGWIVLVVYVSSPGLRYASLYLLSIGTFCQLPMFVAWAGANIRGGREVAVAMAWANGFGNCANFVATNVFIKGESPRYPTGLRNGLTWTCLGFCLMVITSVLFAYKNRQMKAKRTRLRGEELRVFDATHFTFYL